jgi:hypothetical protein
MIRVVRDPETEARRVRNYAIFSGIPAFVGFALGIMWDSPALIALTALGCVTSLIGIHVWSRRIAQARADKADEEQHE